MNAIPALSLAAKAELDRLVEEARDLLGGLEVVVVPQLLAGDDLGHVRRSPGRLETVQGELALEPLLIELRHLALHRVDAEVPDVGDGLLGLVPRPAVVHGDAAAEPGEVQRRRPADTGAAARDRAAAAGPRGAGPPWPAPGVSARTRRCQRMASISRRAQLFNRTGYWIPRS